MARPRMKKLINVYTLILIAVAVAAVVIGLLLNSNEQEIQEPSPLATAELLINKLKISGLELNGIILKPLEGDEQAVLKIDTNNDIISGLNFCINVYPVRGKEVIGSIQAKLDSKNALSMEMTQGFVWAVQSMLIDCDIITDSSSRSVDSVMSDILKVIKSASGSTLGTDAPVRGDRDLSWRWGEYYLYAYCQTTDIQPQLIITLSSEKTED